MKNPIIVPTDFSEVCENALAHACGAAKALNTGILLLHVVNRQTRTHIKKNNLGMDHILKQIEDLAKSYSNQYHIHIDTAMPEGNIFNVIPMTAAQMDATFIFLGTHGKAGIQRLTGSHALKLIYKSTIPVIVVQKRTFGEGYRNIVIPVSNPLEFELKISRAVTLAEKFNAYVHLFENRETNPLLKRDINLMIEAITAAFIKAGIKFKVDEAHEEGNFANQVLNCATINRADLIMIMTNARDEQPEFILGPWDEKILFNTTQIPVMCINPLL